MIAAAAEVTCAGDGDDCGGSLLRTLMMGFEDGLLAEAKTGAGGRRIVGRPLSEETIWDAKVWVPGPGAWVEVGARGRPGWARAGRGSDIDGGGGLCGREGGRRRGWK